MRAHVSGSKELIAQLKALGAESEKAAASAVRDTAFAVKADVEKHVSGAFAFSGPSTQSFVSRFKVTYGRVGDIFRAVIAPAGEKSAAILGRFVRPTTIGVGDGGNLTYMGLIAIPNERVIPRGRSGRVSSSMTPEALLRPNSRGHARGFLSADHRHIMVRRRGSVELAYTLTTRAVEPDRLDVPAVAEASVRRNFDAKLRSSLLRAWSRHLRRGARR